MQEFYPISSWALFHNNYHPYCTWTISDIGRRLEGSQPFDMAYNSVFGWYAYPQVMARPHLTIDVDSGILSMRLKLYPRHCGHPPPLLRPLPTVYYVLRDCKSIARGAKPRHVVRACSSPVHSTFSWEMDFACQLVHKSWLAAHTRYNHADSIILEVFVEPPAAVHHVHSYLGVLNWSMEDVSGRKEAQTFAHGQESPYFYTGPGGYRVQARVIFVDQRLWRANGLTASAEEEGVTVEVAFLSGENDADLSLTFAHRTTVTLRDELFPEVGVSGTMDPVVDNHQSTYRVFLPFSAAFLHYPSFNVEVAIQPYSYVPFPIQAPLYPIDYPVQVKYENRNSSDDEQQL